MDKLTQRTAARLAKYRASAVKGAANYGANNHYSHWRAWYHKGSITSTPNNVRGDQGQVYSDSTDQYGTYQGHAHDIARAQGSRRVESNGWCADHYQAALIIGGAAKLRTARGTLYIPVTHCNDWDGTVHYLRDAELVPKGADEHTHAQALLDAACTADHHAEREAEEAREGAAKDAAEQDIATAREEVHTINAQALDLIREIKAQGAYTPAVCKALHAQLQGFLRQRREQFATIAERESNYWTAVQP